MADDDRARTDELGQTRVNGLPGLMQRIGAIEGVAVLLLVSVGLVVFGLASHVVWPVVVGAVLGVFTIADIVILALVRRRFPR
ncbi:hypothetical protein [Amnibacterium endophyticum]|uniref:Uncharacterized protein n=1 Tax=Amnibacterium endophyticum TaxID=2109337 RepID=A0ABW4LC67_9MICO